MKIWTYLEAKTKLNLDFDLEDETFITPDELAGYFNDSLNEAESEIISINEDYLKSRYYVPVVVGTAVYELPDNIYANKIRKIMFSSGSDIYEINRFRGNLKFEEMAMVDQYGAADPYRYDLINDTPGQAQIEFHPTMRDTATLSGTIVAPVIMTYIRNCARIPILGEYCNPEVVIPTQVNTTTYVITHKSGTGNFGVLSRGTVGSYPGSIAYVTGDAVKFEAGPGGTLPAPLVEGTVYYVIATSTTTIKLATSLANATAGTAITITTAGTIYFTIKVAATLAIQNATVIDIPEFMPFLMSWVKAQVLFKEKDPGFSEASQIVIAQKKQMIDTLTNSVPDDDDKIIGDYSHYEESN